MQETTIDIPKKSPGNRNAKGRPTKQPPLAVLAQAYAVFTAQEIANMYGVPVATVRSWIARARKAHREEMERLEAVYPQNERKGLL